MMFTKETYKDGHRMVDGVFRAISKDKVPNPPKDLSPKYYYSTNRDMKYIKGKCAENQCGEYTIFKRVILLVFIFIVFFLVLDFFNVYRKVKRDNEIERDRCKEEYKANKCNEINIEDGPIINDYCMERKKCIKDNVVCFHEVLIRYIKNVIFVSVKGYNLIHVGIVLLTILIIFRIKS